MKLDTLYILDYKGKIRIFDCEIIKLGNENLQIIQYGVITKTGLLEGKLIEHRELVKQGKQKRSISEQARFQALALWQEKWDEGYKSLQVLEDKADIHPGVYLASIIPHLDHLFTKCPEAAYTNQYWDELPMLAYKYKDIKNPVFPYYIQPKLNGVRCLVKSDNVNKVAKLSSRGGQYYKIPVLEQELYKLLFNLYHLNQREFILDGEIYKHGVPLQEISGAARKENVGSDLFNDTWLEYHIYDIIEIGKGFQYQEVRLSDLWELKKIIGNNKYIKVIDTYKVNTKEEIKIFHDEFIIAGYEGAILRNPKGEYDFNQRSKSLLKVKEYQDEEFKIIGCNIDPNKSLGESFVFILENNINSLTFEARPTGTLKQKEDWYNNQSWVGKKATVRFFERSNMGLPQQGSVRHNLSKILIEHIRPQGE